MKRIYYILIVVTLILAGSAVFFSIQAKAQGDTVAELKARLTEQGVPLQDIKITSRIPYRVEVIIQSVSQDSLATQDDAQYVHVVQREVALAQKRYNLKLDSVQLSIINSKGDSVYWSNVPIQNIPDTSASKLDNSTTSQQFKNILDTDGMALESLSISSDANGWQTLKISLVADTQTVNAALPQFMNNLFANVEALNAKQGAQIVVYEVDIVDSTGQPLMKYSRDLQLNQENWWQADGVTQDWFPHPAPPTP